MAECCWYVVTGASGHMYDVVGFPVCFCLFAPSARWEKFSHWVSLPIWLWILLLIAFWHFLCPYGTKASCWITCWLFLQLLSKPSAYTVTFFNYFFVLMRTHFDSPVSLYPFVFHVRFFLHQLMRFRLFFINVVDFFSNRSNKSKTLDMHQFTKRTCTILLQQDTSFFQE